MPENKYQVMMNGSTYIITDNGVSYKVDKDGNPYGWIDLGTASKKEVEAFRTGIVVGTAQALDKSQQVRDSQINQYGQPIYSNYPSGYAANMPNYPQGQFNGQPIYPNSGNGVSGYYPPMPNNQSFSQGQGVSQGTSNKTLTLGNGHSIIAKESQANVMNNNWNQGGFAYKFIMSLIVGFGLGVIATAVYIFLNLGNVTFSL